MNHKILFTLCLSFLICFGVQAQKFGYVNSSQLLVDMPEVKQADSQLESYQKQLVAKGEGMLKTFEANYTAYVQEANTGSLSKVQMQNKEAALATEQQNIQKYEQEVQMKLVQKREELYQPILAKVQTAIDAIGAEENYTMIFDTSTGALLHANSTEDLLTKIKSKLGI